MSDLGNLLIELRGKESLRDAANRIGISHTYLRILEKGVDLRSGNPAKATSDTLRLISKAYNYSYEDLLRVSGIIDNDLKDKLVVEEKMKLADMILNLPDNEKKLVMDMVETLMERKK